MLTDQQRDHVRSVTRTVQIIVGAMAVGVVTFFVVVLLLVNQNAQFARRGTPVITYFAILLAIVSIVAHWVVPRLIANYMRQAIIDGKSAEWGLVKNMPRAEQLGDLVPITVIYQTRMIVGIALLEAAAFVACVAFLLERRSIDIVIAGGLLAMIASQFPTFPRLEEWVESERTALQDLRQLQ